MRRAILAALVAGAVLVTATAAAASHRAPRIRLSSVPLQTAQLGPAGASLALNYGSGSTENGVVFVSIGDSPIFGSVASQGNIGGYALDYGDPYTGSTAVTEIRSGVEEYKTRAEARKALASGNLLDRLFESFFLDSPFVDLTVTKVKPSPVGQRRFGYLITQAAPNLNPIVSLDEQVLAGRFVLDLIVTAGSPDAAEHIAPHLLRVLHRRLQLALGGHPAGKRVKLPSEPEPGQAPGGPDLSALNLQPSDVGQSHAVNLEQGYTASPPALSDFFMDLEPAGTYNDGLQQQIGWWPTATEATYAEIYGGGSPYAFGFGFFGFGGDFGATVTPVDLSSVDDPATGYLVTADGQSSAYVVLTNGQAGESIVGNASHSTLQASDVLALAQAAANRLDAGLGP